MSNMSNMSDVSDVSDVSDGPSAPLWATRTTMVLGLLLAVSYFLPWLSVSMDLGKLGGPALKIGKLSGWNLTMGRMSSVQVPDAAKQVEPDDPPAMKVLMQPHRHVSARPWYALALILPLGLLLLGTLHRRGSLSTRAWANTTVVAGLVGAALCLLAATVVIAGNLKSSGVVAAMLKLSTHSTALLWCCAVGHLLVAGAGIGTRLASRRSPQTPAEAPRRITAARVLVGGAGTAVLLLLSLLAYARWIMDPENFVIRNGATSLADREHATLSWHRGAEPCLRNRVQSAPAGLESRSAARDLMNAGFGNDVTALIYVFAHWQTQHEAIHHRQDAAVEYLRYVAKRAGVFDRMVLWLARDRIVDSIRNKYSRAQAGQKRQARAQLARLSPERRRALRALWERHPRQLSMPNMIHVIQTLSVPLTHRRADALVRHLRAYAKQKGRLPEDLSETVGESIAERKRLNDGWYARFKYTRTDTGARITSYGADHEPGGTGKNADIVRHLTAPPTRSASEL